MRNLTKYHKRKTEMYLIASCANSFNNLLMAGEADQAWEYYVTMTEAINTALNENLFNVIHIRFSDCLIDGLQKVSSLEFVYQNNKYRKEVIL